jgi:heptosyltransferase-1
MKSLKTKGRNLTILVVRLGAMGDILRTLPAVRLLRRGLPEARILWTMDSTWQMLFEGHPDLDQLLPVPRKQLRECSHSPLGWPRWIGLVSAYRKRLRDQQIDLVLDFHGNLRSGLIARLSGATACFGYAGHQQKEGNRFFSTHRVAAGDNRTPRMERNLDLIRVLGLPDAPLPGGDLPLVAGGAARARDILGELSLTPGRFAVIAPATSLRQAYKIPPAALLGEACQRLAAAGITPLVVWGPGELEYAQRVVDLEDSSAILAPATDLGVLAALLAEARLFVGGDTGPLHLACAVGCPVIGIYGPTDPQVNQPWGVPYRTVYPPAAGYTGIKRQDRSTDFSGIEHGQIAEAVDQLLDTPPS